VTRARGYDPLLAMTRAARTALRRAGLTAYVSPVLRVVRDVADQSGLDAPARAANLSGAFAAREVRTGRLIVVVDDIITTGATALEATRALTAAGDRCGCGGGDAATLGVTRSASYSGETRCEPWPWVSIRATGCRGWGEGLVFLHGTRPGPWLRRSGLARAGPESASRCQPQAKRPT
jgi:hypothetical protein